MSGTLVGGGTDREALEELLLKREDDLHDKLRELATAPEARRKAYGKWIEAQQHSIDDIRHTLDTQK